VKVILGCSNKNAMLIGAKVDSIEGITMRVHQEKLGKDVCCQSIDMMNVLNYWFLLFPLFGRICW
jgi:hypothetical protein